MRVISQACIIGLLAGSFSTAAAQAPMERTVERSVKALSNKNTQIGVYLNVLPDCTSGPLPTIRLVNPPTAGKVVVGDRAGERRGARGGGPAAAAGRPGYRLQDEVKSIITVVAKTHHYWSAHVTA